MSTDSPKTEIVAVAYSFVAALRGDFQLVELPVGASEQKRNAIIRERMGWSSVRGAMVAPVESFRQRIDRSVELAERRLAERSFRGAAVYPDGAGGYSDLFELDVRIAKETAAKLAMLSETPAPIETPAPAADPKRELVAELAILAEYDATRGRMGHDYGNGQRKAELGRRSRELRSVIGDTYGHYSTETAKATKEELAAAFERVGRPRVKRAESEDFRRNTPATSRTLRAWAMVERWATGARAACACGSRHETPVVEPPASTEEAVESAAGSHFTPPPASTEEAIERFAWRYSTIVGGGDKWRLSELRAGVKLGEKIAETPIAVLIRRPSTLTRVFATDYGTNHFNVPSQSDHSTPADARRYLAAKIGVELPELPAVTRTWRERGRA